MLLYCTGGSLGQWSGLQYKTEKQISCHVPHVCGLYRLQKALNISDIDISTSTLIKYDELSLQDRFLFGVIFLS